MRAAFLLAAAAIAFTPLAGAADAASGPLTVCLNKDNAPFSFASEGQQGGFDLAVAEAVARELKRPLEVRWYQKERRRRGAISVKTSVLVNAGVCDLVGGFPLVESSLDRPGAGEETTLPPVDGMPEDSRKKSYKGSKLLASHGYHFAGMTPVVGPRVTTEIKALDDLLPYRLAHRPASSGDLITMAYKKGLLLNNESHVDIQTDPLEAVAKGDADATITEQHGFDLYRAEHPDTPLRGSGLVVEVGFNLGFVTTEPHAGLLDEVNAALDKLLRDGELARAAEGAKLTFVPPQQPFVRSGLGLEKMAQ